MPYKVVMLWPDGTREDLQSDESYDAATFETYAAAEESGLQACSDFETGGEVLNMHNPGDYPRDEDEDGARFEVIEVES